MAITKASDIPTLALLYKLGKLVAAPPGTKLPLTRSGPSTLPTPSNDLNDRVALLRADITTLDVDAIVNAANNSLLGGGGVDGAIHRAAGRGLLAECKALNGCPTGSAKITGAHNLPCRKVIHAVGPIYDALQSDICESQLAGCYTKSLELAVANSCKTIAFSSISTGVYGYPSREAAPVAIGVARKFLEKYGREMIQKIIFVTFEQKDVDAYNHYLPQYFPPVSEDGSPSGPSGGTKAEKDEKTEATIDAEAKAVADKLPSAPTAEPADGEHVDKKQKH